MTNNNHDHHDHHDHHGAENILDIWGADTKDGQDKESQDPAGAHHTPGGPGDSGKTGKQRGGNADTPMGGVTGAATVDGAAVAELPPAHAREGETRKEAWERIRQEGRAAGLGKREAYQRATVEADRLFPPVAEDQPEPTPEPAADLPPAATDPAHTEGDHLDGLGDIPASWGDLPANAQLAAEVQWVQANRIRVRDGSRVDLGRSLTPAPSHSALSWLETAILFPSKFADVSVKATSNQADEAEHTRRERADLSTVESLLSEMSKD